MTIQVEPTRSNLASAMLNSKIRPHAVVGYGVKIFLPSPPNYVTRSPGGRLSNANGKAQRHTPAKKRQGDWVALLAAHVTHTVTKNRRTCSWITRKKNQNLAKERTQKSDNDEKNVGLWVDIPLDLKLFAMTLDLTSLLFTTAMK